jgi:hypothetical protein
MIEIVTLKTAPAIPAMRALATKPETSSRNAIRQPKTTLPNTTEAIFFFVCIKDNYLPQPSEQMLAPAAQAAAHTIAPGPVSGQVAAAPAAAAAQQAARHAHPGIGGWL